MMMYDEWWCMIDGDDDEAKQSLETTAIDRQEKKEWKWFACWKTISKEIGSFRRIDSELYRANSISYGLYIFIPLALDNDCPNYNLSNY